MAFETVFQILQRIATLIHRLNVTTEELREFRQETAERFIRLETQVMELRERLSRLETFRDADRAQLQAEIARFKTEMERAELRFTRMLPESKQCLTEV